MASDKAHTPGPWGFELIQKRSDRPTVGYCGDFRIVRDGPGSRGYDLHGDQQVDAALLAAAPDLLDALCDALVFVEDAFDDEPTRAQAKRLSARIRSLVAKAEGS